MKSYAAILPLAVLSAMPVLAQPTSIQEGGRDAATAQRAVRAGQEAKVPSFIRASAGARAALETPEGINLGKIQDHVLDAGTGRITHVAVETTGGESVLVPHARFSFDAEAKRFVLEITPEALAAQPAFLPDDLRARATEASSEEEGGEAREAAAAKGPRWILSSELTGTEIEATDGAFGTIAELLIDRKRGHIAFVLVATDGTSDPVLVPWNALEWSAGEEGATSSLEVLIPHSTEVLANAPRLTEGDLRALDAPERLAGIREFFSVPVSPRN